MHASGLVAAFPGSSQAPVRPARHVPAAGLAGSALADRFCFWRGRSGRRYVFSVYRLTRCIFTCLPAPRQRGDHCCATCAGGNEAGPLDGARLHKGVMSVIYV